MIGLALSQRRPQRHVHSIPERDGKPQIRRGFRRLIHPFFTDEYEGFHRVRARRFPQTDDSAVPSRLRPCGRIKKPPSGVNQRAATVGDNGADEAAPPGPNGFAGTTIATLAAVSVQWRRVPDARWRNGRADLHEAAPTACPPSGKAVPQGMDERRQRGVRCGMHGLLRDSHANFHPVDIENQRSGAPVGMWETRSAAQGFPHGDIQRREAGTRLWETRRVFHGRKSPFGT